MKLLQKRPIAILIMLVAIGVSLFIGGRRSLLAERERILDYFYSGSESGGYSIQDDLEYLGATANNLKTVALRYLDTDDSFILALGNARAVLDDAQTLEEKYNAATQLYSVASALYTHLNPSSYHMNSTDKSFRSSLYEDLSAAMKRIEANSYNTLAAEFNEMLDDALTGTIARLVGVQEIPLFG